MALELAAFPACGAWQTQQPRPLSIAT